MLAIVSSLIISVGGLVVAALALVLNYKSRTNALRESLYRKQLDLYPLITGKLLSFHDLVMQLIHEPLTRQEPIKLTESGKVALRSNEAIRMSLTEVQNLMRSNTILIPSEVSDAMEAYIKVFLGVSAPNSVAQSYPPELIAAWDPGEVLSKAFVRVVDAIRTSLGIEPLHAGILAMIGTAHVDK